MIGNKQRAAMAVIAAVALLALAFSTGAWLKAPSEKQPAQRPKAADPQRNVLLLNGDRDADEVAFNHTEHQQRLAEDGGCATCHHLHKPSDPNSSCRSCHSGLEEATSIFNHDRHGQKLGGNDSCARCHDLETVKSRDNAIACSDCHADDMSLTPSPENQRFNFMAPGYQRSLHSLCMSCHRKQAEDSGRPELSQCDTCHRKVHHEQTELNWR